MTREEILNMPAGREMDVRVGVAIGAYKPSALEWLARPDMMEWLSQKDHDGSIHGPSWYGTDIGAAFAVLKTIHDHWSIDFDPAGWGEFRIYQFADEDKDDRAQVAKFNTLAELPAAICRAALLTTLKE